MTISRTGLLTLLSFAFLSPLAHATLGESEASVAYDATRVSGSIKMQQRANFRVHEISLPSGTELREFVSSNGQVFAVAWRGPSMPNLKQTLGSYFDKYVSAAQLQVAPRRHVGVRSDELVVESAGHMRAFHGLAYLPQALPAGFDLGELQ
jgi:hypothetical protein